MISRIILYIFIKLKPNQINAESALGYSPAVPKARTSSSIFKTVALLA